MVSSKIVWSVVLVLTMSVATTTTYAVVCSYASGRMSDDAQEIRLKALDLGWQVGKSVSLAEATVIRSKVKLYPKDHVEVCLKELNDNLMMIRM